MKASASGVALVILYSSDRQYWACAASRSLRCAFDSHTAWVFRMQCMCSICSEHRNRENVYTRITQAYFCCCDVHIWWVDLSYVQQFVYTLQLHLIIKKQLSWCICVRFVRPCVHAARGSTPDAPFRPNRVRWILHECTTSHMGGCRRVHQLHDNRHGEYNDDDCYICWSGLWFCVSSIDG